MSFDTLAAGVPWDEFETFPQYLDAVRGAGHGPQLRLLRRAHRGAALRDGRGRLRAAGHRRRDRAACRRWWPTPWRAAPPASPRARRRPTTATAAGRCRPGWPTWPSCAPCSSRSSSAGAAWWRCCPGGVFSNEEVFRLQREVGRPFTWTALLTVKGYPYHEKVVAEHDAAWADGVEVWPQVSCRPLVFQMNLSEPFTLNMRPTFAALMGKSKAERARRLPRPVLAGDGLGRRERQGGRLPAQLGRHFGGRVALATPSWPTTRWPCWPRSGAARRSTSCSTSRSTTTSRRASGRCWPTTTPRPSPGCCRATTCCSAWPTPGAHVSQLCDACFSTDLLGNWVRERGVMPLERAIHKLTGEPAGVYGLADRGTIEVGKAADLCVFDPEHRRPRARCAASATSRPTASA